MHKTVRKNSGLFIYYLSNKEKYFINKEEETVAGGEIIRQEEARIAAVAEV
jgi:hypothetical protein